MSCERFHEAIAGHAAGAELDQTAAAHLTACDTCAGRLDLQRRLLAGVDSELVRALAMTASPELVAGVTARIRTSKVRPAAWRPAAAWMGLAAAAAIAGAIYLRAPLPAPSVQPSRSTSAAPPAAATTTARPAVDRPVVAPVRREAARRPAPRAAQPMTRPVDEPAVLVDGSQLHAIARLQELLASGRLHEKTLPSPAPHDTAELTISPIQISDITVPDVDIAGRAPETLPR